MTVRRRWRRGSNRPLEGGPPCCVRTCDGRYCWRRPATRQGGSCNSFCPASATEVVYGGNIDNAATEDGKRTRAAERIALATRRLGLHCNGKGPVRPRRGEDGEIRPCARDIVAGKDGLMSVGRPDRRGASLNFTPAPDRVRAKYERAPVLARE